MRKSRKAKMLTENNSSNSNSQHQKFVNILHQSVVDPPNDIDMEELSFRFSNGSDTFTDQPTSPLKKSPWSTYVNHEADDDIEASNNNNYSYTGLMGSLVREEGHIYSLATSGDLLYTGSDSKNIRVWKNQKEFSGFNSNSGLVKAIVIAGERIFTGHQDGKIRLWKASGKNPSIHRRVGTLPTLKACIKKSINPSNYVEVMVTLFSNSIVYHKNN